MDPNYQLSKIGCSTKEIASVAEMEKPPSWMLHVSDIGKKISRERTSSGNLSSALIP